MVGSLTDTYVAALQHDLVDLPDDTERVGVVRKPTRWFHAVVDDNRPALGPPESLLEAFQERQESFAVDGLCEEEAHNAAWDAVDFDARYREYLDEDAAGVAALEELQEQLENGTNLALVCYENTETKRCHRTLLAEELRRRLD